ncbi:MAG: zf-HC2 domain-containing protein [Clostridia bacterium]|jgi:hypothetical protein|nr:zf-HC2 domain-containing protein [Clostridia bacterium]
MNCEKAKEMMHLYIDNMLSENEREEFLNHINNCNECKEELSEFEKTVFMLKNMNDIDLPKTFHEELMIKIEREEKKQGKKFEIFKIKFGTLSLVAAALIFSMTIVLDSNKTFEASDEMYDSQVQNFAAYNVSEEFTPKESPKGLLKATGVSTRSNVESAEKNITKEDRVKMAMQELKRDRMTEEEESFGVMSVNEMAIAENTMDDMNKLTIDIDESSIEKDSEFKTLLAIILGTTAFFGIIISFAKIVLNKEEKGDD